MVLTKQAGAPAWTTPGGTAPHVGDGAVPRPVPVARPARIVTAAVALAIAAPFAALTTQAAHRLLLAAALLDIPFQFDTSLALREETDLFGGIGGYTVSLTTMVLALLYLRWAVLWGVRPRAGAASGKAISRPLAAYLLVVVISSLVSLDFSLSLRELFLLGQIFLLYVYLVCWTRTPADVRFVMAVMLAGLAAESLLSLAAAVTGTDVALPGVQVRVDRGPLDDGVRAAGTFGSPNVTAAYLSFLLAPSLTLLLAPVGRAMKALALVAAALSGFALILTQSRGGWLGTTLAIVILWWVTARPGRRLAVPVAAAAVLVPALLFLGPVLVSRVTGDDHGSSVDRIGLAETALKMVRDNPVLGVGPNNYTLGMKAYGAIHGYWGPWVYTVHNKFLLVWAETGLAGLVTFVVFLFTTVRTGWRAWRLRDSWLSPLALGFAIAIVGQAVHMQFDIFNSRAQVQLLWVGAAVVAAISAMVQVPVAAAPSTDVRGAR